MKTNNTNFALLVSRSFNEDCPNPLEDYLYPLINASSSLGKAKVTDYAKANGVWWAISGQNIDTGYWWLRSPDSEYYFCAEIYELGSIGICDTIEIEGVRPAIEVRTLN